MKAGFAMEAGEHSKGPGPICIGEQPMRQAPLPMHCPVRPGVAVAAW